MPQAAPGDGLPAAPVTDAGADFENTPTQHVFHFTYAGEPRPLKPYLAERYRYWLRGEWLEQAYPGRVRVNRGPVHPATVVQTGDLISYLHYRAEEPPPGALPVLYEDEWLLAVHKPGDIPVSPSGPHYFASLAIHAREAFGHAELTPIHRLDLETDGPLLLAKRKRDLKQFHRLFIRQTISKTYRALVQGQVPAGLREIAGHIRPQADSRIVTKLGLLPDPAAEHSRTRIDRVVHHGTFSELALSPLTGKTNQLRVHLAHYGHPIVGDKKYHPDEGVFLEWIAHKDTARLREQLLLPRQALHCASLAFIHPFTGQPLHIAALPGSWRRQIAPLADSALEPRQASPGTPE